MVKLAPVVWSLKRKEAVPIYVAYQDMLDTFEEEVPNENSERKNARRKYRRELLGIDMILGAHDEYWEIGLAKEYAPTYTDYRAMPIHDRAKVKAFNILHNMAQILERHEENQIKKREQSMAQNNRPSQTKSKTSKPRKTGRTTRKR